MHTLHPGMCRVYAVGSSTAFVGRRRRGGPRTFGAWGPCDQATMMVSAGSAMETGMNLAIDVVGGRGVLVQPRRREGAHGSRRPSPTGPSPRRGACGSAPLQPPERPRGARRHRPGRDGSGRRLPREAGRRPTRRSGCALRVAGRCGGRFAHRDRRRRQAERERRRHCWSAPRG